MPEKSTRFPTVSGGSPVSSTGSDARLPACVATVAPGLAESYPHTKRVGSYLIGRTLGEGSFAKVREGLHTVTGEKVAIKVIDKKSAREDAYISRNLRREGRLMQLLRHPNIVQLLEILETENSYYLVLELCEGGDLMEHICKKRRLDEAEVRRYLRQVVSAVQHLHDAGIIHRDLKVENLLLDENMNVKLIDFGLSNSFRSPGGGDGSPAAEFCVTQCGSPAYAAPELLGHKRYGPKVDVWSIGVNMYAMLTGSLPFTVDPFNIKALHRKMLTGDMNPLPGGLSIGCRELLRQLLTSDPDRRPSLKQVCKNRWLNEGHKGTLPVMPFPNRVSPDDLDSRILNHMRDTLKLSVSDTIHMVVGNKAHQNSAIYHLLKTRLERYTSQVRVTMKKLEVAESVLLKRRLSTIHKTAGTADDTTPETGEAGSSGEVKPQPKQVKGERPSHPAGSPSHARHRVIVHTGGPTNKVSLPYMNSIRRGPGGRVEARLLRRHVRQAHRERKAQATGQSQHSNSTCQSQQTSLSNNQSQHTSHPSKPPQPSSRDQNQPGLVEKLTNQDPSEPIHPGQPEATSVGTDQSGAVENNQADERRPKSGKVIKKRPASWIGHNRHFIVHVKAPTEKLDEDPAGLTAPDPKPIDLLALTSDDPPAIITMARSETRPGSSSPMKEGGTGSDGGEDSSMPSVGESISSGASDAGSPQPRNGSTSPNKEDLQQSLDCSISKTEDPKPSLDYSTAKTEEPNKKTSSSSTGERYQAETANAFTSGQENPQQDSPSKEGEKFKFFDDLRKKSVEVGMTEPLDVKFPQQETSSPAQKKFSIDSHDTLDVPKAPGLRRASLDLRKSNDHKAIDFLKLGRDGTHTPTQARRRSIDNVYQRRNSYQETLTALRQSNKRNSIQENNVLPGLKLSGSPLASLREDSAKKLSVRHTIPPSSAKENGEPSRPAQTPNPCPSPVTTPPLLPAVEFPIVRKNGDAEKPTAQTIKREPLSPQSADAKNSLTNTRTIALVESSKEKTLKRLRVVLQEVKVDEVEQRISGTVVCKWEGVVFSVQVSRGVDCGEGVLISFYRLSGGDNQKFSQLCDRLEEKLL
ncbi:PREDICTED: serine/threonine-protein kinase par-1-like [Branchiostoma belcheri]|uniref:non-specific serine/threonine protein kinase n=1 Tax=Branchiostoma belcheri TaxID=7741 RepID=A0A6P5AXQ1_BRABE|nr:PREDICTED: serine/threonine-protein kinase par-1-like [Branchiostoma belcheri]